jgi:putative membrane protein insertion efficiency factor
MEITFKKIIADIVVKLVLIFKQILFIPNGVCRYYPTCTEYARNSITKYPLHIAFIKIFIRVIKCNPFFKGRYDPVK